MADSLRDQQDAFSKRLQQMRADHGARTDADLAGLGWDPASLPPPTLTGSVMEQMAVYNDWLDERVRRWRGEAPLEQAAEGRFGGAARVTGPRRSRTGGTAGFGGVETLATVDDVLFEDFELKRFPAPSKAFLSLPVFCETREQFLLGVGEGLGLTGPEVSGLLARCDENARGVSCMFVPGLGCLVDCAAFPGLRVDAAATGGVSDFEARLDVLRAITLARWGWGFLLEYTTQGRAMQRGGLYAAWVCRELGSVPERLRPALARLEVFEHSQALAFQGWQDWIWNYLLQRRFVTDTAERRQAKELSHTARMTAELVRRLAHFIKFDWGNFVLQVYDVADLLNFIVFQFLRLPERADEWMRGLENAMADSQDEQLARAAGMVRAYLAQKYFKALEAHLGSYCLPYVMMIAFHIPEEACPEQPAQLRDAIRENPQINANTRLLRLTQLNASVCYNPHALRIAARDTFHLNTPDAFFRMAGL